MKNVKLPNSKSPQTIHASLTPKAELHLSVVDARQPCYVSHTHDQSHGHRGSGSQSARLPFCPPVLSMTHWAHPAGSAIPSL